MVAMTALPIFSNSHLVMVHSTTPINGEIMGEIMAQILIRGVFTSPTVLEELLDKPEGPNQIAYNKQNSSCAVAGPWQYQRKIASVR